MLGKHIRDLRKSRGLTLRVLADRVGVGFTYLSKIENEKLEDGHAPSEKLIHRLAVELDADEQYLLQLASRIPPNVQQRIRERPDVFYRLATLSDSDLDGLVAIVDKGIEGSTKTKPHSRHQ